MRDIAFMPERHVLVSCNHVAADHARQSGNVLAADRIAFMRHRGGTFLTLGKSFFHLTDFALLQGADFGGKFVERRCYQC
ncbi:hypothetical protein D3C74_408210 [compost metagenome]